VSAQFSPVGKLAMVLALISVSRLGLMSMLALLLVTVLVTVSVPQ
jgi:hypothetical protein